MDSYQTMEEVISIEGVYKEYGAQQVLSDVNLKVNAGECVVLVGHNGAGKTSLMKQLLGLSKPTKGRIQVLGYDPMSEEVAAYQKKIGYLPESVAFYDAMSGREVLSFYAQLKGVGADECDKLLSLVGLEQASDRKIRTYSKGMRQRLGLAQAMLGNPQLLFLDEPTTGLDPLLRQHFYQLIETMHKAGTTSIISSHALNEVEARADRFVIMRSGAVVACGTLDELYNNVSLPVQVKLKVRPGHAANVAERLSSGINITYVNNESLNLDCLNKEKMMVIRLITELGDVVNDMQIIQPRLDEVYNYYMQA